MHRVQQALNIVVVVCLSSHLLCCVVPTIASLIGIGASLGLITAQIPWAEFLHIYETEMMIFSGAVIVLAAISTYFSQKINCNDTGCSHDEDEHVKTKNRSVILLYVAIALFAFNLLAKVIF